MTQCINAGIEIISDTKFRFDGVLYENKHLKSKIGRIHNLLTTSKVLEGKPRRNELYWAFLLSDGSIKYHKDKYKYSEGVVYVTRGKLFLLIHKYHTGELYQEASEQNFPTKRTPGVGEGRPS